MMKQAKMLNSVSQLETLKASLDPLLLYFSTPSCMVCEIMLPKVLEALQDYPYDLIDIDAAEYPEIAGQHRIFAAPTVLVFYEGKEVLRESRFIDIDKITHLLDLIKAS
jgi:thioredoxin-like negative regulator of GroEL